jgi:hypothetical protein
LFCVICKRAILEHKFAHLLGRPPLPFLDHINKRFRALHNFREGPLGKSRPPSGIFQTMAEQSVFIREIEKPVLDTVTTGDPPLGVNVFMDATGARIAMVLWFPKVQLAVSASCARN